MYKRQEQGHGGVEAAAHLVAPSCGVGLTDELAESQRQARRGQRQQKGVDVVGAHEVGDTLITQDVVQGDLVQGAADFDEHGGDGQHRYAAHKDVYKRQVSAMLGRMPSAVGYQPTLAEELGALEERITSTRTGSITSVQAIYVPADEDVYKRQGSHHESVYRGGDYRQLCQCRSR